MDDSVVFPISEKANHMAIIFTGVTSALLFLSLLTATVRIRMKLLRATFGLDDWFIVFSVVRQSEERTLGILNTSRYSLSRCGDYSYLRLLPTLDGHLGT